MNQKEACGLTVSLEHCVQQAEELAVGTWSKI